MRLGCRTLNPKARSLLVMGNLCLCASLALSVNKGSFTTAHASVFDFLRGVLMGSAIVFNLCAVRLGRRIRTQAAKP